MADDVTYEWVDGPDSGGPHPATREEWARVCDVVAERGWMALNRTYTRVLLARRGEDIVGFHVMQLVPHTEPLYVAPTERGTGIAEEMADRMVEFLKGANVRGWITIADSPHAKALCEERGMTRIKSPVYQALGTETVQ